MKTINLSALNEFTFEDIERLTAWLENVPATGISLEKMKSNPPVRTSKIGSMLKVLEPFGLISRKQERYALTSAGKDFSQSGATIKKAVLRNLFIKADPVQRLVELLQTSVTGRLPVKLVHEAFNLGSFSMNSDADIHGFIVWAQACELFGFDKKAGEIFRMDSETPRGPTGVIHRSESALTLSKAS